MKKYLIAFALVFALLLPWNATAAVKAGGICIKLGSTSTYAGKKYTCVKSGKKLVWDKGTIISKPASIPSTTPSPAKTIDPKYPKQGDSCPPFSGDAVGYNLNNILVIMMCNQWDDKYFPREGAEAVNQNTGIPVSGPLPDQGERQNTQKSYIAKPIPVASPKGVITAANTLASISQCKLENAGHNTHFAVGFPMWAERAKLTGKLKVAIVPVDFPDLQDTGNPLEHFKDVLALNKDFFEKMTNNKVTIEYISPTKYIRMPKSIYDYNLSGNLFEHTFKGDIYWDYVREAVRVSDSQIDFSGASVMMVLTPPATTIKMIGTFVAQAGEQGQEFKTNEGNIFNVLVRGNGKYPEDYWGWVHEFGHMLGLTDIRDVMDPANQNSDDMGDFDLMNSLVLPELLVWERFTLGIVNDDQIRCVKNGAASTHWIVPVEELSNRTKGIVIPLSATKAIVVESRRKLGYDINMKPVTEGVLIYTVDTTVKYGMSPLKIVPRNGSVSIHERTDATLHVNDSVNVGGWKISVTESGEFGDVVKVEKVG
jgi:M6 family metalloprotease-like protein